MRKCALFVGLCGLAFSSPLAAQDEGRLQVGQLQGANYARLLRLDFGALAADKADKWFLRQNAPGTSLSNYFVYVVLNPESSSMQVCDVSRDYLDAARQPSGCAIPADPPSSVQIGKITVDADVKTVDILLRKPLHAGTHYIFSIRHSDQDKLEVSFSNTTSIITPDPTKIRSVLMVKSAVNLRAVPGQPVTVSRAVAEGPAPMAETYPATINRVEADGIVLVLQKELPSGKSNPLQLEAKGLTDNYATAVKIQGKVQGAPAVSKDISNAFVTTQLSAMAAVHSAPTFSGTGAIAPWHPASRMIWLPGKMVLDPAVNFDVGSANANSSNSVIIPSQFSRAFTPSAPSSEGYPIALETTFGPRAEFDTQWGGVNLLGEGRAEFYIRQFSHSVDVQKAVIAAGNPGIRDLLELPMNGYSIVPYVQVDAGGHLNSQSISNPTGHPAVDIPKYDISRLYLGIQVLAQLGRNNVSLDASYIDLFLTETVPYTTNEIVYSRSLSGFQPHSKLTYSYTFDDAKHFAGLISWEDGRSAPTFRYLNKVTAGLQVTY